MKNFMMLFRDVPNPNNNASQEDQYAEYQRWQQWIDGMSAHVKYLGGEALGFEGKTLSADGSITDGPYAEIKEIIGGYIIIEAEDLNQALKMANGCPVLENNGCVEVRDVMVFDN